MREIKRVECSTNTRGASITSNSSESARKLDAVELRAAQWGCPNEPL
jgi:hypothetical protein